MLDERQGKREEELESTEPEDEELDEELELLLLSQPASHELQMHSSLGPAGHWMKPQLHSSDEELLDEDEEEDEEELLEPRGLTGWQGTGLWGLRSGTRLPLEQDESEEADEAKSSEEELEDEEEEEEEEDEGSFMRRLRWGFPCAGL